MRSVSDMQRLRGPTQPPYVLFIVLGVPRNPFYRGLIIGRVLSQLPRRAGASTVISRLLGVEWEAPPINPFLVL